MGRISRLRIALATALALACGRAERPPDVLLLTVDTLRADAVGAYAGGESVTPNLDRLAAEGTLFERASAVMPLTRPSHASMLTSVYPREHGVLNNSIPLAEDRPTLPEILRERGYRTAGVVSVRLLARNSGFSRGFEHFGAPTDGNQRPGADSVSEALDWIAGLRRDERFFLWLHLFDPHMPYAPPPGAPGVDPELAAVYPEISWPVLEEIARAAGGRVTPEILEHARHLYRAEVATVDGQIGRLLDGLRELRELDDVLLIVTADHGECFERGVYFEHSDCLFEGAIRVPLIVRYPREFEPGRRVRTSASGVDVTPTVLSVLGVDPPEGSAGRPLQSLADEEDRYVLIQHPFYHERSRTNRRLRMRSVRSVAGDPLTPPLMDRDQVGLVGTRWKYLVTGEREELYALTPEVDEGSNLAGSRGEVRARLRAALDRELAEHPLAEIDPGTVNEELMETLRALGYAQ